MFGNSFLGGCFLFCLGRRGFVGCRVLECEDGVLRGRVFGVFGVMFGWVFGGCGKGWSWLNFWGDDWGGFVEYRRGGNWEVFVGFGGMVGSVCFVRLLRGFSVVLDMNRVYKLKFGGCSSWL